MNHYLQGTDVLGADAHRLALPHAPMSAEQAHRIVEMCLSALDAANASDRDGEERRQGLVRQLFNIDQSIESSGLALIPAGAADVLRNLAAHVVYDEVLVLKSGGADVLGMIDIDSAQRQMTDLRPVTVRIARALLKGGQSVINDAITKAKQPWYKSDLPGATARDNAMWKLKWHADELARISSGDDNAMYPSADDLKKWVMQAFIESNAVEEGNAYLDAAWSQMWTEIQAGLAAIPKAVREAAINATSGLVQSVTGVPLWGWAVIGVGTVGLLGWVGWKLANSKAGAAVAHAATRHYLR